jgi:hypothetical protein
MPGLKAIADPLLVMAIFAALTGYALTAGDAAKGLLH